VSAFEPAEAAHDPGGVRFPIVMRGYDRHRVDDVVQDLVEQLAQEHQRAEAAMHALHEYELEIAHRQQAPPSFADLGLEAGKVFEQAGAAAEKLVADAADRAQLIVAEAEAKADDLLRAAEERAAELEQAARETLADAEDERARLALEAAEAVEEARAQAEQETKDLVAQALEEAGFGRQKAESERQLVETETKRLRTLRQFTIDQLRQMQAQLGLALTEVAANLEAGDDKAALGEGPEPSGPAAIDADIDTATGTDTADDTADEAPQLEAVGSKQPPELPTAAAEEAAEPSKTATKPG